MMITGSAQSTRAAVTIGMSEAPSLPHITEQIRDADALLLSLPEPIAVVGNGWIRNRHDAIEEHATIIRFNDYADVGWEPHVGHRCDVWCVTCCGTVQFREQNSMPKVMTIATEREQSEDISRWLARYPDMAVPGVSWIRAARELKPMNPSTGLTLLCRLLFHAKRFTAFAFAGMHGGHYWNPSHAHLESHDNELPALFELARRGVVFK